MNPLFLRHHLKTLTTMSDSKQQSTGPAVSQPNSQFIQVAIVTTSGSYPPDEGEFLQVPINQPIARQLAEAARKLGINDTAKWVAKIGTRMLDPTKSYADENLAGEIEIDYGPAEGGGGHA